MFNCIVRNLYLATASAYRCTLLYDMVTLLDACFDSAFVVHQTRKLRWTQSLRKRRATRHNKSMGNGPWDYCECHNSVTRLTKNLTHVTWPRVPNFIKFVRKGSSASNMLKCPPRILIFGFCTGDSLETSPEKITKPFQALNGIKCSTVSNLGSYSGHSLYRSQGLPTFLWGHKVWKPSKFSYISCSRINQLLPTCGRNSHVILTMVKTPENWVGLGKTPKTHMSCAKLGK